MSRPTPALVLAALGTLVALAGPAAAHAAPENTAAKLKAGQVACITRKDAGNYAAYALNAPKFAADLLDRAACFKPREDMDAILLGHENGFTRVKLLSGHVVWFPTAQ
jgi:hypothetical protein